MQSRGSAGLTGIPQAPAASLPIADPSKGDGKDRFSQQPRHRLEKQIGLAVPAQHRAAIHLARRIETNVVDGRHAV